MLQELKPQSKVFQLRPEYPTVLQLNEAFISLGVKNCTKIAKESGHGVTIHGLRAIDIQNCWLQLKEFVDSRVTVTVNIDLGYWQVKFLQQKHTDLFTSEEKNECEAKFPSFTLPRHQSQSMTVTVALTGKVRSTRTTSDKIKRFCSGIIVKSSTLHCKTKYIKLWKKRWENIKSEKSQIGILVDFREMQSESDQVVVDVTVVSNESIQVNKAHNDIILNENGSRERLCKHDVNLSTAQFEVLHHNLSIFQERIEKVHSVIVELEVKSNQKLTLLTLPGNDAALVSAEIMLIGLISSLTPQQQPILKELVCKDDITILLFLTAKSIYFSRLKQIADQHSVEVLPIKDKKVLKLRGIETKIKIVEDKLNTLMTEVRSAVECTQLAVSEHHYPILSSDAFKKALSEIQQERHILCSHHSSRRVLRQALLKSQLDHKVLLQIVVGSLAGEAADAIVVPAGTQDPKMINLEMAESFSKHVCHEGKSLNVGDVISLPSGSYPSKLALHVVLPKDKDRKNFILGCWSCIQIAKSKGLKSLSFPMLGVDDQHHVSVDSCINDLLFCIDHLMSKPQASLDKVCIVITDDVVAQVLDYFDKRHFKSQSAVANVHVQPSPSWCWNNDKGQYSDYPEDISDKLNQAKNANPIGICYFEINSRSYVVDFSKMIQRNIETCHTRKVLCKMSSLKPLPDAKSISGLTLHRETCAIKLALVGSAQWYYKDDDFIFVAFSFQDSAEIESMFQKRIPDKSITIDSRTYNFDFERMKQINVDSGYERDLNREEMAQSNGAILPELSELFPEVEYYVNIQGLKIHLRGAKQRIIKQLNKLCLSKSVQLPVSSTSDFIQKLTSIARRHQVISLCDDRQAASCQSSSVNQRYINIKGAEQLVHRAVTEIQDKIIKFQSTLTASAVEYPSEWEPCLSTTVMAHLIELTQHSTEWKHIVDKFKETMPNSEIISIKRIQNKWLWEKYAQTKKRMYQKNSGEINEKELWHGSRRNAESIYDSEEGFDMRFSSDGMWGRANYFATDARYSVKYAFQRDDGTKELLLARVLTGDSYDSLPNKKLTMPPEKPTLSGSKIKLKQVRYDSVTGITNNCRVYMTYSNERAYPAYLVQFSVSPILPPTTASQSTTKSVMALTRLKLAGYMYI